jgi:hypothetical protein
MNWGCYYPFSLTFPSTNHFSSFVKGEFVIMAFLNPDAFQERLSSKEVSLRIESAEHSIKCWMEFESQDDVGQFAIGGHMLNRMWTDFLYPSWIVKNAVDIISDSLTNK